MADLLDALARQAAATIDTGGSPDDEPFRSALRLAVAIVGGSGGARPGPAG